MCCFVTFTCLTPLLCKFLLLFQWIIFNECTGNSIVVPCAVHSPMTVSALVSDQPEILIVMACNISNETALRSEPRKAMKVKK